MTPRYLRPVAKATALLGTGLYTLMGLAFLAGAGLLLVLLATSQGVGVSPDSTLYVDAARSVLQGHGFTAHIFDGAGGAQPLTYHPPLFPALLALFGLVGFEPLASARWLNMLCFAANIGLVGWTIRSVTTSSRWMSLGGAFLMMANVDMVEIHSMAWTEPLFMFLSLAGVACLARYLEEGHRCYLMMAAGITALAWLDRYPGIVLVATGVVGLLSGLRPPKRRALQDASIFTAIAALPMIGWLARNAYVTGSATGRSFVVHPLSAAEIVSGIGGVLQWIIPPVPAGTPEYLRGAVALIVLGIVTSIRLMQRWPWQDAVLVRPTGHPTLPYLLILFIGMYITFLLVSISFFDANTVLNQRMLSPIFPAGVIVATWALSRLVAGAKQRRRAAALVLALWSIVIAMYLGRSISWVHTIRPTGLGYTSRAWQGSTVVGYINSLPQDIVIFSNVPDAVYYLTGRTTLPLPRRINPYTEQVNDRYQIELAAVQQQFQREPAILVYFHVPDNRWALPSEQELRERLSLRRLFKAVEGAVYQSDQQSLAR